MNFPWIFHMNLGMNILCGIQRNPHPFGSLKHQGSIAGLLIHVTHQRCLSKNEGYRRNGHGPFWLRNSGFKLRRIWMRGTQVWDTANDLKDRFSHDITPPATTHYLSFIIVIVQQIITHVLTLSNFQDHPWHSQIFPFLRRSWRRRSSHGSDGAVTLLSSSESEDPWAFLATWPHDRSGSNLPWLVRNSWRPVNGVLSPFVIYDRRSPSL